MFVWDDECDGASEMTTALLDNDVIFDTRKDGWDFNQTEAQTEGTPETYNERWMKIGEENWPFTITDLNTTDSQNTKADLFSFRDWTEKGFNLTLWMTARDFDGKALNGTISIEKLKGITYQPNMPPVEVIINVTANLSVTQANFTDGKVFMPLDIDHLDTGDYEISFKVNALLVQSTNSAIALGVRYAGVVSNNTLITFLDLSIISTLFSVFLYSPRCRSSFAAYFNISLWRCLIVLSVKGILCQELNTLSNSS